MLFAALSVTIPMDIKKITIEHDENKTIDDLPEVQSHTEFQNVKYRKPLINAAE